MVLPARPGGLSVEGPQQVPQAACSRDRRRYQDFWDRTSGRDSLRPLATKPLLQEGLELPEGLVNAAMHADPFGPNADKWLRNVACATILKASSTALFGSCGLGSPAVKCPWSRSQSASRGCLPTHPSTDSTSGESLHTQVSSSGSRTMAAARLPHPEAARRFSISCSKRWRGQSDRPQPSRSNMTIAWRYCRQNGRRKSWPRKNSRDPSPDQHSSRWRDRETPGTDRA